jgi:hypothetical protein
MELGEVLLVSGFVLMGVAALLDLFMRERMTRIGYKWALLQGGAFNHAKYHQERKQRGWSAWPVYLMWAAVISGIALVIGGFFVLFGTAPIHVGAFKVGPFASIAEWE